MDLENEAWNYFMQGSYKKSKEYFEKYFQFDIGTPIDWGKYAEVLFV